MTRHHTGPFVAFVASVAFVCVSGCVRTNANAGPFVAFVAFVAYVSTSRCDWAKASLDSLPPKTSTASQVFGVTLMSHAGVTLPGLNFEKINDFWCRERESNPHNPCESQDFKSYFAFPDSCVISPLSQSGRGFRAKTVVGPCRSIWAGFGGRCHTGVTRRA